MGQIDDAIQEHFRTCSEENGKKFVPWMWVVLFFAGIMVSIAGATAYTVSGIGEATSRATSAIEHNVNQDKRLDELDKEIRGDLRWIRQNLESKK